MFLGMIELGWLALGLLRISKSFPMPLLTYCKMAGPKYVVAQSRNKKSRKATSKTKSLHTISPTHFYKSDIHSFRGWAASSPPRPPLEN